MTKILVFAAPSGTGKSTLIAHLMEQRDGLSFSISATSRPPRGSERDGVEYHFLTPAAFREKIERGEFLEYCEVYAGRFYGTLKADVDLLLAEGRNVVCDLDVIGALNIKKHYGDRALLIFVMPPSIAALRERLEGRGTDSPEFIEDRLRRAEYELSFAPKFDRQVVNDNLAQAKREVVEIVDSFLTEKE